MTKVSGMHGVRLKGLKDCMQTTRKIVLSQVLVPARRPDIAHQASNLLEFVLHNVPLFLVLLHLLLTY